MNIPETASLSEFVTRKRADRLRQVKLAAPGKAKLFRRVYDGKASPRQCIKAFCIECVGYEEIEVRDCTAPACPLWNLRPYRTRGAS